MKVVQINTSVNTGSTGRITEEIGQALLDNGHQSYIAFGRTGGKQSQSAAIKIGSAFDQQLHGLQTRIFDTHGFGSKNATEKLVAELETIQPDIVHLHNLHGYYLHVGVLFEWLNKKQLPVVWTLHDCWSFTGHCTYFDSVGCERWKTGCFSCPKKTFYPSSFVFDNSKNNYRRKKELFNLPQQVHFVTPSQWLANHVKQSYLQKNPVTVIHNGIDIQIFHPSAAGNFKDAYGIAGKKIVLGVASTWDKRKGLADFIELRKLLPENIVIVLVGLNKKQTESLPAGIIGIERTEDVQALAALYAKANVFVNPTWQDNFPTTNIEALACGIPVLTYRTGGSPEAIDGQTGFVTEKGEVPMLAGYIRQICEQGKEFYEQPCRQRAENYFNKKDRYQDYISLYTKILVQA